MPTGNYEEHLRRFAAHPFTRPLSAPGVSSETCSDRWMCASLDALFCVCPMPIGQLRIEEKNDEDQD